MLRRVSIKFFSSSASRTENIVHFSLVRYFNFVSSWVLSTDWKTPIQKTRWPNFLGWIFFWLYDFLVEWDPGSRWNSEITFCDLRSTVALTSSGNLFASTCTCEILQINDSRHFMKNTDEKPFLLVPWNFIHAKHIKWKFKLL